MVTLKEIVENNESKYGRLFDLSIQSIIILSIVAFTIDTLPDLSSHSIEWLRIFEICSVSIFTIEYLLRILVADSKLKFILSFYGIVDLLAILPFYIALGIDLRSLRIVRLIRLFRAFKFVRYNIAIQRFLRAILIVKEEFVLFSIITAMVLFISSVGIYYFENNAQPEVFSSVFKSMWWSVATLTTVGYGDIYPVTVGGKLFTFFVLMVGLGIVAVPTGLIASALTEARKKDDKHPP